MIAGIPRPVTLAACLDLPDIANWKAGSTAVKSCPRNHHNIKTVSGYPETAFFVRFSRQLGSESRPLKRLVAIRWMPGRRFAFGNIFVAIMPASAGDTPMALKELDVRDLAGRGRQQAQGVG